MAEELAVVYVPIVPETSKIAPGVRSALGGAAKYAERDGAGIGSKLSTGIGKTLKTGAVATGAAVAGVLGAAMTWRGWGTPPAAWRPSWTMRWRP